MGEQALQPPGVQSDCCGVFWKTHAGSPAGHLTKGEDLAGHSNPSRTSTNLNPKDGGYRLQTITTVGFVFVWNNFVFESQTSERSGWIGTALGISAFSTHHPAMTSSAFELILHAFIEAIPIWAGLGQEVSRWNSRPCCLINPSDSNLSASSTGIGGGILGGILATQLSKVIKVWEDLKTGLGQNV